MSPLSEPQRSPSSSRTVRSGDARVATRVRNRSLDKRRRGDAGVSIVEVLIASIILLITMLPMGILLTRVSSASADARQRQAALQLADSWVEILSNSQPPTSTDPAMPGSVLTNTPQTPVAPAGTRTPPSTLAGTTFAVKAAYSETLANSIGQSDLCTAGQPPSPSHPGVIQLNVTVTWDARGNHTLSVTTEINYPKPGLQTEGFLAINLTNNSQSDVLGNLATDRIRALPVTITQVSGTSPISPNPYLLHSDPNGCVFAQVPVGVYNISIGQPSAGSPPEFKGYSGAPPFVTPTGSTTDFRSNQQVGVTAETVVQIDAFDEGIYGNFGFGGASAVDGGVTCPVTASIRCITFGDSPTGASAAWGGAGSAWATKALAAGTHLNQVACTTAASPYCVGVGYGPSGGVIVTTPSSINSLSNDTVPAGVTDITQVVCKSDNGCYALGTSNTGPVLLAGYVGSGSDRWVVVAHAGITFSSLNSLACPTSTTCELSYAGSTGPGILRMDGDPATLASNPFWTPTLNSDSLPGVVTSAGSINCPSVTTCVATAVGDASSSANPTVITVNVAGAGPSSWISESTFPTNASSVTAISCTGTTCVAIGSATTKPAVWTGSLAGAFHSWIQSNGIPNALVAVTAVACGNPATGNTVDCAVTGTSSSTSASGVLLDGSLTGTSWSWNNATVPSTAAVQYYLGVSCGSPVSVANATCAAVGATPAGPIVLSSATGPGGNWSDVTPSSLPGAVVTGIPVETAPSGTTSWTTQIPSGQTPNATTIPTVLYPQASGYSIAAGDCPTEATSTAIANLNAAPGGTATATVPLGLLPLTLQASNGAPVVGATITLTSLSCPGADAYNLPATDATGATSNSIPYGSYSYTVTVGGTATAHTAVTLVVGANSVKEQATNGGSFVTYYLPSSVPVAG